MFGSPYGKQRMTFMVQEGERIVRTEMFEGDETGAITCGNATVRR